MAAWLFERGIPLGEIPYLDDWTIQNILDPPRDERGRLKVKPKRPPAPSGYPAFLAKWGPAGQGLAPWQVGQLWRDGLRA